MSVLVRLLEAFEVGPETTAQIWQTLAKYEDREVDVRPSSWRASLAALAAYENRATTVVEVHDYEGLPEWVVRILRARRLWTIGGLPVRIDNSLPNDCLYLYGDTGMWA